MANVGKYVGVLNAKPVDKEAVIPEVETQEAAPVAELVSSES